MYSYPNNWQHFPNVIWDIVWPYIFVFLLLKCIVSSLLYSYLSIMQLKPSYLFVRIPNLLCTLKYVNSKAWGPFCVLIILGNMRYAKGKKNHVKLMWIYPLNLAPQEDLNFVYIYLHTELHLYLAEESFCCDSCSTSQQIFLWLLQFLHMEMYSHPDLGFLWRVFFS